MSDIEPVTGAALGLGQAQLLGRGPGDEDRPWRHSDHYACARRRLLPRANPQAARLARQSIPSRPGAGRLGDGGLATISPVENLGQWDWGRWRRMGRSPALSCDLVPTPPRATPARAMRPSPHASASGAIHAGNPSRPPFTPASSPGSFWIAAALRRSHPDTGCSSRTPFHSVGARCHDGCPVRMSSPSRFTMATSPALLPARTRPAECPSTAMRKAIRTSGRLCGF